MNEVQIQVLIDRCIKYFRDNCSKLALAINGQVIGEWFKEQQLEGCSHPLKGRLNRLGKARAWDYKQYQRKNSKFVFGADQNRLLSSVG